MMDNDYTLAWYSRGLLDDARAAAERQARADRTPILRPALAALARTVRARYARWSSAAPMGSKPAGARAWSRSR